MAKVLKIDGCQAAFRVDRISAVDRIKEDNGWVVRIFVIGISDGYRLCFNKYEEKSAELYETIIKAMEEE